MEQYIKNAIENDKGPYYDKKNPSHLGVVEKVNTYLKELKKAEAKGHKINIM